VSEVEVRGISEVNTG